MKKCQKGCCKVQKDDFAVVGAATCVHFALFQDFVHSLCCSFVDFVYFEFSPLQECRCSI